LTKSQIHRYYKNQIRTTPLALGGLASHNIQERQSKEFRHYKDNWEL